MKVRITDPGFAGLTGQFGSHTFVDGVSEEMSQADAEHLACILSIETLEGLNPSTSQKMVDRHNQDLAELGRLAVQGADQDQEQRPAKAEKQKKPRQEKPTAAPAAGLDYSYTREDLEKLADAQGIAGVRSFAEPYAVAGRSIPDLIDGLVQLKEVQASKAPAQAE